MNDLLKRSLVASAVLHSLLLGWALVKLGTPQEFDMANSEALPVDLVPISDMTQVQQGDKEAPKKDVAAPVPTKRPETVKDAENVGDNDIDLKSAPKPIEKPSNMEAAAAPKPTEKPTPEPEDKPNEVKDVVKEETDVAEQQPEPKPQPEPEPAPPKPEEQKPAETPPEETPDEQALPEDVPVPAPKPVIEKPKEEKKAEEKPKETKTAEAKKDTSSDKKKAEKKQEKAKSQASQESDFNADEIANLLNKTDSQGTGAKRLTGEKAFGAKKTTGGQTLSQSELDGIKGQIYKNWTYPAGLEGQDDVVIELKFSLDESGDIVGEIEASVTGGPANTQAALLAAAKRAIRRSVPFQGLPADKYDSWSVMAVQMNAREAGF